VIAPGVFASVANLSRKLMKYIRAYAKSAIGHIHNDDPLML
jgi:hypothetical protein